MKNVSDKNLQRKSRHTFYVQQLLSENRAVYEIMWINIVQPDRPQMTIWRMRIACWIPKATHTHTHTHSEYVIPIAFPLQQWLHQRISMLRYTHIDCLVNRVR